MHTELIIAKLVTVLLGLLIAGQAYRGYRRHASTPMLYLSVGFILISVGSVLEGILFDVVGLSIFQAGTVETALVAAGMLVILYSLYGVFPTSGTTPGDWRGEESSREWGGEK
ncbi:DUF7521 family protein [Halorarius litoreus]|uniref:DUF7521 family protein n=1 Tax=Halorarius litoreus TaxID=2962676 RepID=UPI0020CDB63D|nr:hypothetical protein [Halorarius litoreus]